MAGLIGRKLGMTQLFAETGAAVPVTVIEAGPCPVTQVKTRESDGYDAVQVAWGQVKAARSKKAELGHAQKAGLDYAPRTLNEFRVGSPGEYEVGQSLTVEQFAEGDRIKVIGRTKGRGFQGVVKRHGFRGRPATHGHPRSRNPGSLGPGTDPSRVIKGKKLPGQMGDRQQTLRNVRVERVDPEKNLIFVRGPVPGSRNSLVLIRKMG
ncbi:MAG TPA: 50S ribosomal protein L3 [Longimicrobiales bacterium]|nr:50S ribosomal protein L3 [Longimicrobiales bacterium]